MKRKTTQTLIDIVAAIVVLASIVLISIDVFPRWANMAIIIGVLPACIAVTDITRWGHPEYFDD